MNRLNLNIIQSKVKSSPTVYQRLAAQLLLEKFSNSYCQLLVISKSMEPVIQKGDIIFLAPINQKQIVLGELLNPFVHRCLFSSQDLSENRSHHKK